MNIACNDCSDGLFACAFCIVDALSGRIHKRPAAAGQHAYLVIGGHVETSARYKPISSKPSSSGAFSFQF
jgi:hypothetical protein